MFTKYFKYLFHLIIKSSNTFLYSIWLKFYNKSSIISPQSLVIKLKFKNISNLHKIYKRTYMKQGGGNNNDPNRNRKNFLDTIWGYHIKKSVVERDPNQNTETTENVVSVSDSDYVSDNVNQEALNTNGDEQVADVIINNVMNVAENAPPGNG